MSPDVAQNTELISELISHSENARGAGIPAVRIKGIAEGAERAAMRLVTRGCHCVIANLAYG